MPDTRDTMSLPHQALDWLADTGDQAPEPGKMANTLLAASIFRRFDVRPARKAVTMKMTNRTNITSI